LTRERKKLLWRKSKKKFLENWKKKGESLSSINKEKEEEIYVKEGVGVLSNN